MVAAVRLHAHGGPEALRLEEVLLRRPGAGEALIRHHAAGVNFVDIYLRNGLYPLPLPAVLGVEAAGVVEAVGEGVELRLGERVAWAGLPVGGYCAAQVIDARRLLPLPAALSFEAAAAGLLRGLTVSMVLRHVAPVLPGQIVLIHAAAGGIGLILAQWARRLGARVLGTVGSEAKAELAQAHGVETIVTAREDFVAAVRRLTDGRGVDVVVDGIGGAVLKASLEVLAPFGRLVSLGQASGSLPDITLEELGPRRSLILARPSVLAFCADLPRYRPAAVEVLSLLNQGLEVTVGGRYPLADAAAAHHALEGRQTVGALVLIP